MQDGTEKFENIVRASFGFLEDEYGGRIVVFWPSSTDSVVRYETQSIYVELLCLAPSYKPKMQFGRRGIDDAPGAYSFEPGDLV